MSTTNLLTDISSSASHTIAGTYSNVGTGANELEETVTIAGTGSIVILMTTLGIRNTSISDSSALFRMTHDGSHVGPELVTFSDNNTEANDITLMFALTGLSAGTHTFAVQAEILTGSPVVPASRVHTFQVIEITAGATLEVDVTVADEVSYSTSGYVNLGGMTGTFTPTLNAIQLMIAGIAVKSLSNTGQAHQFAVGGTREGMEILSYVDFANALWEQSLAHISIGNAASSTVFSLQGDSVAGAGASQTESTRNRVFQVIEITENFSLETDLSPIDSDTATGSYTDVSNMSDTGINANSTDSVLLVLAGATPDAGNDIVTDFRLDVDSGQVGPEFNQFADLVNEETAVFIPFALTGKSGGSVAIALQWQETQSNAAMGTTYRRGFQVLDLKNAAAGGVPLPIRREIRGGMNPIQGGLQ